MDEMTLEEAIIEADADRRHLQATAPIEQAWCALAPLSEGVQPREDIFAHKTCGDGHG